MLRLFLFALCAAATVLAESRAVVAVEEPVRFHVRAPSAGRARHQGQVSAATLFGLVKRTGCDGTSLTGPSCPQGGGCCYYDESCCGPLMCLVQGESCCGGGTYSCSKDESCCGSGCMPDDATCCDDGTWSSSGQSGCGVAKIFSPAPTYTDARYGLPGETTTTRRSSPSAFTYNSASLPTFSAGTDSSAVSGGCVGAQKVLKDAAAYKGGGGGHGGGGSSSGSSDSGSSSDGSSSGTSSGSGTTSGGGPAGCASSAPMTVLSMGTLMGAFLSTIILM